MTMTVAAYQTCAFISSLAPFALLQRNAHRGWFNDPISVCDLAWPWKQAGCCETDKEVWHCGGRERERKKEREMRRRGKERGKERGRGSEGQVTSNL